MKRLILALMVGILLIGIGLAYGQTTTQTTPIALFDKTGRFGNLGPDPKYVVQATLTASSGNSFSSFQINGTCDTATGSCSVPRLLQGWYLYKVESWSGSPAPTNAWTATIKDGNGTGFDFCATKITGSASANIFTDCYGAGQGYMFVNGPLTVAVAGNSVASAVIRMNFYFLPR